MRYLPASSRWKLCPTCKSEIVRALQTPRSTKIPNNNLLQPYLKLIRADKPIGTWLLFLPCSWSIALAAAPQSLPSLSTLVVFGVGSFVMRSAGCIINDMWDKDIDKQVERTKSRPLASGAMTQKQSLFLLAAHLSAGLGILLSLNQTSIILGMCCVPLVVVYPLLKRITYWPQAFLGLTFNWGALMGWTAVHGSFNPAVCLPLYSSAVLWTLIYDTIYAFQDIEDDKKIGTKSTALLFGHNNAKLYLSLFGTCMIGGLLLVGYNSDQSWIYYAGVASCAVHLAWQIRTVDLHNTQDCLRKFKSNRNLGLMLLFSIVLGNLLKLH